MKNQNTLVLLALLAFATINAQLSTAQAQATAFTFQGQLASGAGNANGSYDLTFAVWDANVAGNFIAGPRTNSAVAVSNGLFTVTLDFGAGVFTGTNCWVEMGVRTNGGGAFATLVPRQQLTPTPYALYAPQASNALYAAQAGNATTADVATLANTATALSAASPQLNSLCPPGSIMAYAGSSEPPGWKFCNGAAYSTSAYLSLYTAIGYAYGGSGSSFNVPDLRGVFPRGLDSGRGFDPGRALGGAYQVDSFALHHHPGSSIIHHGYNNIAAGSGAQVKSRNNFTQDPADYGGDLTIAPEGGTETRPKNVSVNYIIKY